MRELFPYFFLAEGQQIVTKTEKNSTVQICNLEIPRKCQKSELREVGVAASGEQESGA